MDTMTSVYMTGTGEQAGCGRVPADRGSRKPQQRFADTPILADVREESQPAQNRSKAFKEAESQDRQAISGPSGGNKRSTGRSEKAAPVGGVLGWPGPTLVTVGPGKAVGGSNAPSCVVVKGHGGDKTVSVTLGVEPLASLDRKAPVSPQSLIPAAGTARKKDGAAVSNAARTEAGKSEVPSAKPVAPETVMRAVHGPQESALKKDAPAPDGTVLPPQMKQAQVATATSNRVEDASLPQSRSEKPQATGSILPATPRLSQPSQPLSTAPKPDQPLEPNQLAGKGPVGNAPKASGQGIEGPSGAPEMASERRAAIAGRAAQGQIVQPVAKEARSDGPKGTPHAQSDLPTLPSAESVAATVRAPVQSQMPTSAAPSATGSPAQNLGEQILDSMHASLTRGDRQVLVRLHPPELGTVLVRFREDGHQVSAVLEVARGETHREVEQALPGVLRGLQDAGIQVRRFEVVTSDLPEKDFARGQAQQDGWTQHQGSSQDREHSAASPQTQWSQAGPDHSRGPVEESVGAAQGTFADGRIDMLL